jgi:hypothetical protein
VAVLPIGSLTLLAPHLEPTGCHATHRPTRRCSLPLHQPTTASFLPPSCLTVDGFPWCASPHPKSQNGLPSPPTSSLTHCPTFLHCRSPKWLPPPPPLSHGASASPTLPMDCQPSQRFGLARIGPGGIVVFLLFLEILVKSTHVVQTSKIQLNFV